MGTEVDSVEKVLGSTEQSDLGKTGDRTPARTRKYAEADVDSARAATVWDWGS